MLHSHNANAHECSARGLSEHRPRAQYALDVEEQHAVGAGSEAGRFCRLGVDNHELRDAKLPEEHVQPIPGGPEEPGSPGEQAPLHDAVGHTFFGGVDILAEVCPSPRPRAASMGINPLVTIVWPISRPWSRGAK